VYLDYQSVEGYEYRNLSYADMVELVEYVEAMGYDFHDVAYVWEVAA